MIVKKNAIIPFTLAGLCNTISVSVWPKPPTFGSTVNAWSAANNCPSLTTRSGPDGTETVTTSPRLDFIDKL